MHELDRCGQLSGTLEQLARVGYCTPDQVVAAVSELRSTHTADVYEANMTGHTVVTVINRRMRSEWTDRLNACNRKRKERSPEGVTGESHENMGGCHAGVTEKSRPPSSSSSSSSERERALPQGGSNEPTNTPTRDEFRSKFAPVGIPVEYLDDKWAWFEGNNAWLDKNGRLKKWDVLVSQWWATDRATWNHRSKSNGNLSVFETAKIIEATEARMKELRDRYRTEYPDGPRWDNDQARKEFVELKSKRDELRKQLTQK
jgi:hypothetical protein